MSGTSATGRRAAGVLALTLALSSGLATRSVPAHADEACKDGVTHWISQPSAALAQIGVPNPKSLPLHGDGVTVAVVDSGVDDANQHFPKGSVLPQVEKVAGTQHQPRDVLGHGTAVASIIGARPVNQSAMVGIAPGVRILPVRVYLGANQDSAGPTVQAMAEGIEAAVAAGAQVVVVPDSTTQDDRNALANAVATATAHHAVVVASAGDVHSDASAGTSQGFDTQPRYPAALPNVVGVTGVDADGVAGSSVVHGAGVSIAAPGTGNLAAYKAWGDCIMAAGGDTQRNSDSYATGYVAGVAALLVQKYTVNGRPPNPADVVYALEASAVRPLPNTKDPDIGWGLLDPQAALDFVNDGSDFGPPNPHLVPRPAAPVTPVTPAPPPDPHLGPLRRLTAWLAAGTTALVLGGLLASRLLRRR